MVCAIFDLADNNGVHFFVVNWCVTVCIFVCLWCF